MKKHILLIALLLQSIGLTVAFGQSKSRSKVALTAQYSNYENHDASLSHHNFFEQMAEKMQLTAGSEMVLMESVPGSNGFEHFRFQQQHNGIPVFGSTYILHEKNGSVLSATGHFTPKIRVKTETSMNAATAIAFAKQAMKAKRYAASQPQPELCLIDPAFPKVSEALRLAYRVDLTSTAPFDKQRFFVDANTGKVLCKFPLILQEGVPSTAKTRYYGIQNITTDSLGPTNFKLHDPTRGEGITVMDANGNIFSNINSTWDLTNDNKDEVALDAHYCAQEYYDMMLSDFDWSGLNGSGKGLMVQVHNNGAGPVNAFWDGVQTNFGDGDCAYGPLTTLEVVGHEFTHGMIDYTSHLVYSSESGAINESLADMFGKMLERNADPVNFDWDLGHSFLLTPDARPFRVMDDPASVGMPDYYKGALWDDFSDVHTNSSIGNLWFSMIVDGKQGTNEGGYNYNVSGIGMGKAGQIVFLVNRNYFTENSDYPDFYTYSLLAAAELFGDGSPEQLAVQEAWKAVGLEATANPTLLDLSLNSSYEVNNTCELGALLPIQFEVINAGGVAYEPSMGASIRLSDTNGNLSDLTIPIDQTLAPGETYTVTIDDWYSSNEGGFNLITVDLEFQDDVEENNFSWVAYNFADFQSDDISVFAFPSSQECFSTIAGFFVGINNESCTAIPVGTNMLIKAENQSGTAIWSQNLTLETELPAFGYNYIEIQADLSGLLEGEDVNFVIDYQADPNPDNNTYDQPYPLLATINAEYLNGFSTDPSLDPLLNAQFYSANPLIEYQSDKFFGSTGLSDDPEGVVHGPDFMDNIDNGSGAVFSTIA
ncbi:MAG: M4 family metallopeptidase, partial [Saprospiraceae bacterium]|nr:M4 family metallopeptidase [Saprospiraceae bacterium]